MVAFKGTKSLVLCIKLDGFCFYHPLATASSSSCVGFLTPRKIGFLASFELIESAFAERGFLLVRVKMGQA